MNLNQMKAEYFRLLKRWGQVDDNPKITMDEVREMLLRLDELFQALNQAGKSVPVRLAA